MSYLYRKIFFYFPVPLKLFAAVMLIVVAVPRTSERPLRFRIDGPQWRVQNRIDCFGAVSIFYPEASGNETCSHPGLVSFHYIPKEVDLEVHKKSKARPRKYFFFATMQIFVPLERRSSYNASQCDFSFQMTRAGPSDER